MFTFCWENKILIGQSTKNFSVKGLEEWKKKVKKDVKRNIHKSRNFGGLNAMNKFLGNKFQVNMRRWVEKDYEESFQSKVVHL